MATIEDHVFKPQHVVAWLLYTLSTGVTNAAAVMACDNFVTNITGHVTNLGVDASTTGEIALVISLFIVGAMLGVLVSETMKSRPRIAFSLPVAVSVAMLCAIGIAGRVGFFGRFGATEDATPRMSVMLGILATSMGMINASIAVATSNQIRITHLTGPATDLAGNFVRAALGAGKGTRMELRWGLLRIAKLTTFCVGAATAARLAFVLRYDLFLVAGVVLALALALSGAPEGDIAALAAAEKKKKKKADEPKPGLPGTVAPDR